MSPKYASFAPDDAVEGGGALADDINAMVRSARVVFWQTPGNPKRTAALWELESLDGDDELPPVYYSMGDAAFIQPSKDGLRAVLKGEGLNKSTNWAFACRELESIGWSKDLLREGDMSQFEGAGFHFIRKPAPKRPGLPRREGQREPINPLVPDELLFMPGDKKGRAKWQAGAAAGKPAAKPVRRQPSAREEEESDHEAAEELDGKLSAAIQEILEAQGEISIRRLPPLVYAAFKQDPDLRSDAVTRSQEEAFLRAGAKAGLWQYDGKQISPAAGGEEEE